jgi:hypothetical protein
MCNTHNVVQQLTPTCYWRSGAALPRVGVELDFCSLVWFFGESYKTFLAGEKKEEKKYLSRKSSYS